MHNIVYKTTNKVNGKVYIGSHSTENLNDGYLGSGRYMKRAIKKHGRENFEVTHLFFCDTREKAFELEFYAIRDHVNHYGRRKLYNAKPVACGHVKGETHPMWGKTHSDELKEKWSKERRGENNAFYGRTHTEETRKRLSEVGSTKTKELNNFYGRHHSEETKKLLSEQRKGKNLKEDNPFYGRTPSEETKRRSSEKNSRPLWFKGEYFKSKKAAVQKHFADFELSHGYRLLSKELKND